MILKVTGLIWNTNTALSRLFGRQGAWEVKNRLGAVKNRLGAVKNRRESREFRTASAATSPPQRQHFVPEN
jgi:hypothetical protein